MRSICDDHFRDEPIAEFDKITLGFAAYKVRQSGGINGYVL